MLDTDALVAGAGPVGIQPRTLELWESAGVLRRALDLATPMRGQLVYVDGRQVARLELTLPGQTS